jgi:hypothetical protein
MIAVFRALVNLHVCSTHTHTHTHTHSRTLTHTHAHSRTLTRTIALLCTFGKQGTHSHVHVYDCCTVHALFCECAHVEQAFQTLRSWHRTALCAGTPQPQVLRALTHNRHRRRAALSLHQRSNRRSGDYLCAGSRTGVIVLQPLLFALACHVWAHSDHTHIPPPPPPHTHTTHTLTLAHTHSRTNTHTPLSLSLSFSAPCKQSVLSAHC